MTQHAKMVRPDYNGTLKSFVWSSMNKISMFIISKTDHFQLWFLYLLALRTSHCRKTYNNYQNLTLCNQEIRQYLPHYWSDKGFLGTVVNQALSSLDGGSLKITLTVPFNHNFSFVPGSKGTIMNQTITSFRAKFIFSGRFLKTTFYSKISSGEK